MRTLLCLLLALIAPQIHAQGLPFLQGAVAYQAATPTFSPASYSGSSTQTVTIADSTPSSTIYYTTDGSTPTTGSTVYSTALSISTTTTVKAIATAAGYTQSAVGSATYTISGGGGVTVVYPRIGLETNLGSMIYPTANLQQLAQYGWILMGGNFPGWMVQNSMYGGYGTRDQVVQALKGFGGVGGKNAVVPQILQYEMLISDNPTTPWFPEWDTAIKNNNWWVYQSGTSGATAVDGWSGAYADMNPAHLVGTDSSTGLYPEQLGAKLMYQRYYLGTGTGGSAMASTHLDGYFQDNVPERNLWGGGPADYLRNGTNPSQTDPTSTTATGTGKADWPTYLATLNSSIISSCNGEVGYDMSSGGEGGLGMTSSPLIGKCQQTMQQFMYGTATSGGQPAVMNWGGFAAFMSWYQTIEASVTSGGTAILTGGVLSTDYQMVRYTLAATLMRNGVAVYGIFSGSAPTSDLTNPQYTSDYPVFDEFWGGVAALAGYMGATVAGARGVVQTASWSSGVWERDFANCAAFVNPAGNGTQTVTVTGLGYTNLYYLDGTQDHTHNPGGGTPVTSLTIAAADGTILCNTVAP